MTVFGVIADLYCINESLSAASPSMREAFYITTIIFNLFATLAIAYKLWSLHQLEGPKRDDHTRTGVESRINTILFILAESAALYVLIGIAFLVSMSLSTSTSILGVIFQILTVRPYPPHLIICCNNSGL
jgi:uncharacterized membrane protein